MLSFIYDGINFFSNSSQLAKYAAAKTITNAKNSQTLFPNTSPTTSAAIMVIAIEVADL